MMQFAVLGNSGNRRVRMFARAVLAAGHPHPIVLGWRDYLSGRLDLAGSLPPGTLLRIDSPGEDPMVDLLLWERVGLKLRMGDVTWGEIHHGKLWYQAFSEVLRDLEELLSGLPLQAVCNSPASIRTMYDKWSTHNVLKVAGVPKARLLEKAENFDHLLELMDANRIQSVFLKPFYGSSASGVIAFRRQRHLFSATTSVEVQENGRRLRLYNSLRIHHYSDENQIRQIVDRLCQDDLLVEEWIPKLNFQGATVDLRVVVIAGKARQVVLRASQSPMTNLHLGNARGDLEAFRAEVGEERWAAYMDMAEKAVAAIPGACYAGVDLLVSNDPDRCYVGEVNAFGDLLPGVVHEGRETYSEFVHRFGG